MRGLSASYVKVTLIYYENKYPYYLLPHTICFGIVIYYPLKTVLR